MSISDSNPSNESIKSSDLNQEDFYNKPWNYFISFEEYNEINLEF